MTASLPDSAAPSPAPQVSGRAASGASLLMVVNLMSRGIGIISTAALARLLTPNDFGIVSLAMIVVEFAQMLTDFQLTNALVRSPRRDEHLYATAFTLGVMRGVITAAGIALAALPAGVMTGNDHVRNVLLVLALQPLIDGWRSPRMVDYIRDIDFSREAVVTIVGRIVAVAIMVLLAALTHSYWALVSGTIVASLTMTIMTHVMRPFRPRFELRDYRLFLGFGGWMSAAAMTNYLSFKLDSLIVAGRFGVARLGQYNLGIQISGILTSQLAWALQRAIFSALSTISDDLPRRLRAYATAQTAMVGVLLPIGVGMVLVAHEAIMVIAGPKWTDAIVVLRFVGPPMAFGGLIESAQALLMVEGMTRTLFLRNLLTFAMRLALLWGGLMLGGFTGMLIGLTIAGFLYVLLTLQLVSRHFHVSLIAPFVNAWRSFVAAAVMIVAVLALDIALGAPGHDFSRNLLGLVAKSVLGGGAYAGTHLLLWRLSGQPAGFERFVLDFAGRLVRTVGGRLRMRREATE
ncbi:lipopolysaccharide biosynthesis protein [Sphingomonas lycopersici]|uniref:Lipopolysaccharide biosynthesis protein n=3 Tax=Sphingomonas TaxID=13687 RepID=A0AA41ZIZ0_9SPHN|nr:lipopolysaccharide biosynthesis protein [Sphingomonas lycopersici]MCW6532759.1 lipopolysaccharide biosynthesis protein [Sphingomonas lycopersici]MCW6536563.1 lipopolysaccharide biosynthesis protein [Sphingomonas lycopersici]